MKSLRTMPISRLFAILGIATAVVVAGAFAVAAQGGSGGTPPPKPLAQALHEALVAEPPVGITARVSFTNKLFPSGALLGQTGSALETGASGRLWANEHGGRLELQSDAGDVQITWSDSRVTVYDASTNTAYTADLPKRAQTGGAAAQAPPTLDQIATFLGKVGAHWAVSGAAPSNVGGQEAYTVSVTPKENGGLLGSAQLAWDALNGVPLKIAVYARGSSAPVLALQVEDVSFGPVPQSDIAVTPPTGAKIVDLSQHAAGSAPHAAGGPVTGIASIEAAAPFTVTAPAVLNGLARQDVRLVGPADGRAVVVVYGEGLGSIVIVERSAEPAKNGGMLGGLPTVSVDGVQAHELSTPLGTVLAWDAGGVSYVLAGSASAATAEAAARALR